MADDSETGKVWLRDAGYRALSEAWFATGRESIRYSEFRESIAVLRPGVWRLSVVLAAVTLARCGSDADLAEAVFSAQQNGVRARVWIPVDEPRSVGTLRAEVDWGSGITDRVEARRDGMVTGVWLDDLTGGPEPELIVATTSAGSGSYGDVLVYSGSSGALRKLAIAGLGEAQREGYMGHDSYSVEGGELLREFPVYLAGDTNARPSGRAERLRYDFARGAWVAARRV